MLPQGERGARSTEVLLSRGYHVVLLYRTGSVMPFCSAVRQMMSPHIDLQLLDCLSTQRSEDGNSSISFRPPVSDDIPSSLAVRKVSEELQRYRQHRDQLLCVPFTSVEEYLSLLESVSVTISRVPKEGGGVSTPSRVLYFLAAAVSDFHLPPDMLPQHKIQSSLPQSTPLAPAVDSEPPLIPEQQQQQQRTLHLDLHPVPKLLGTLVSEWAAGSFVTSFKLETDPAMVQKKAEAAISNYHVHLVVANQLQVGIMWCIGRDNVFCLSLFVAVCCGL